METQLYFWKPLVERQKSYLEVVADYYNKTKGYFNTIDEESREYGEKLYREYPGSEDTDIAAVAEWAHEAGIEMYLNLLTMKSNHLLMTISLLYHTWEQQLIKFTIDEMSHYFDFTKRAMEYKEVQAIFKVHGVSITDTNSWPKIRELKFLTNTIKHGDGDSAEKLRKIRPAFFISRFSDDPDLDKFNDTLILNGAVLLDGYTLRVSDIDFYEYVNATKTFWDEMPERAFSDTDTIITELDKK